MKSLLLILLLSSWNWLILCEQANIWADTGIINFEDLPVINLLPSIRYFFRSSKKFHLLGNYHCPAEHESHKFLRLVITSDNSNLRRSFNEHIFRRHPLFDEALNNSKMPIMNIELGDGKKLKVENVEIITIKLEDIYIPVHGNNRGKYKPFSSFINFLVCPIQDIRDTIYYFDTRETKNKGLKKYEYTSGCSIQVCNIGLYLYKKGTTIEQLLNGGNVDKGFYIKIDSDDRNKLFSFSSIGYSVNTRALLKCPYKNWLHKYSFAKYVPKPYIRNDFPGDGDKLKYVPGYLKSIHEKVHHDQRSESFICGHVEQYGSKFDVGYEYGTDSTEVALSELSIFNGKITCGNQNIDSSYVFGNLPRQEQVISGPEWEYFKESAKLYSGQILYLYDKEQVDATYKEFKAQHAIKPTSVCKNKELPATLKLKVNDIPVYEFKKEGKKDPIFYYKMDQIKSSKVLKLSCFGSVDQIEYSAYHEYYSKKFHFTISMIKNINQKMINSLPEYVKTITEHDDFYGVYSCKSNVHSSSAIIKASSIVIVPNDNQIVMLTKKIAQSDPEELRCQKEDIENNKLIQMDIIIPNQKVITFTTKEKQKTGFISAIQYYYFNTNNEKKYTNETKVKCHYQNDTRKTYIETTFIVNDNPGDNLHTGDPKLMVFISIGLGVTGLILIVIGAVVTILIKKKRKKRRRLRELSLSKSGISGGLAKSSKSGISSGLAKTSTCKTKSSISSKSSKNSIPTSKSTKSTKSNMNNVKLTANINTKSKSFNKKSKNHSTKSNNL
uniref:Exported protein n=1 Tax=Parastrongyloides trichosuri TaxID=131310 RepID=A0A0N4ZLM3_PARTI